MTSFVHMAIGAISIHALREEGDRKRDILFLLPEYFYPRPPRGGRQVRKRMKILGVKFLSTPSARRATRGPAVLCSGRHISIHALREEGDIWQYV